jgi:predicted aminopeptidase
MHGPKTQHAACAWPRVFDPSQPERMTTRHRSRQQILFSALVMVVAALAVGCADTAYLLQSTTGHLKVIHAARPVQAWLADDSTPPALKQRLQLAQAIRRYAIDQLKLPDNASYQRFAQLPRRAVVWNVVAAPTYSLTLKTWCFPVAGCVGYRGYFDEQEAKAQADQLRAQGLEASVYGVPAYSTLGWTNWLGGDPLLSTFIHYPEGELARMVFHEMAHQVLYVKDDTAFNESFATAVERLGNATWLANQSGPAAQAEYQAFDAKRRAFRALAATTRNTLKDIYASAPDPSTASGQQEARKVAAYAEFRRSYALLKDQWSGDTRYDAWVANANNAAFGALAAYDDWVPSFENLFRLQRGDWTAFYAAVRQIAELPREDRTRQLQDLKASASRS